MNPKPSAIATNNTFFFISFKFVDSGANVRVFFINATQLQIFSNFTSKYWCNEPC
jgi:hypothetical protein